MNARNPRNNSNYRQGMLSAPHRAHRHRGTALIEAALVMPFLIILLLGTLEVGRLLNVQQIMSEAAGAGGRQASLGTQSNAQVTQAVLDYLHSANIPTANVVITINNLTHPGLDASEAVQLDNFEVYVSVPVADITWSGTAFFVARDAIVGSRCQWVSACGQTYPTDITVPAGY